MNFSYQGKYTLDELSAISWKLLRQVIPDECPR